MGETYENQSNNPPPIESNNNLFSGLFQPANDAGPALDKFVDKTQQLQTSDQKFDGSGNITQFTTEDGRKFSKDQGGDNSWTMSYKQNGTDVERKVQNVKLDEKSLSYDVQKGDSKVKVTETTSGSSVTTIGNEGKGIGKGPGPTSGEKGKEAEKQSGTGKSENNSGQEKPGSSKPGDTNGKFIGSAKGPGEGGQPAHHNDQYPATAPPDHQHKTPPPPDFKPSNEGGSKSILTQNPTGKDVVGGNGNSGNGDGPNASKIKLAPFTGIVGPPNINAEGLKNKGNKPTDEPATKKSDHQHEANAEDHNKNGEKEPAPQPREARDPNQQRIPPELANRSLAEEAKQRIAQKGEGQGNGGKGQSDTGNADTSKGVSKPANEAPKAHPELPNKAPEKPQQNNW